MDALPKYALPTMTSEMLENLNKIFEHNEKYSKGIGGLHLCLHCQRAYKGLGGLGLHRTTKKCKKNYWAFLHAGLNDAPIIDITHPQYAVIVMIRQDQLMARRTELIKMGNY
tara:strand:+ start:131 stop:466 length:336 start_codon:yes stop_codon:yes gene_type:complete